MESIDQEHGGTKKLSFQPSLRFLKWLAIVLPFLFLAGSDALRQTAFDGHLHGLPGLVAIYAVMVGAVTIFSYTVFGFVSRLQAKVTEQEQQRAALNRIAAAAAQNLSLEELQGNALGHVMEAMNADAGLICIVDTAREEHTALCSRGFTRDLAQHIQRAKLKDDPIALKVVRTGRAVAFTRILEDPNVTEVAKREGIRSGVSAPLKSDGEVTGILVVATHKARHFSKPDQEFLESIGSQLGMAIKNALLYEQSQRQNQEMLAMMAVGRAANSSLDLDEVLVKALDTILDVSTAEAAEVWLMEDNQELVMRCHRGIHREAFLEHTRFMVGEGFPGIVAKTGEPVLAHDLASDPRLVRQRIAEAGFRTFYVLPLRHQDGRIDVLAVAARSEEALVEPGELRLLDGIGESMAVAIENARLHQQIGNIAILGERERIAREMHDGLAQVLAYINAQTSAISRHLADGRTEEAREEVIQLRDAAREVYADVREAILGLRIASAQPGHIWGSLQEYTEKFAVQTEIPVSWEGLDQAQLVSLESATETQLMRIIQEALTNVRKHAAASRVTLSIGAENGCLSVAVEDDGKGFDTADVGSDGQSRFGLHTMRERAESVGSTLHLESVIGVGTKVTVRVPAHKTEVQYADA